MPIRTIKINSREFKFILNSRRCDGLCNVFDEDKGCGFIQVGTKGSLRETIDVLTHEVMEMILIVDRKRLMPWAKHNDTNGGSEDNYVFIFDHLYLCEFTVKVIEGLVSSGFVRLVDGRKFKKAVARK
jgi:hypothetical protein